MSDDTTIPNGFEAKLEVLWRDYRQMSKNQAKLFKQAWIREQEILGLKYEVYALRLRILQLEEEAQEKDSLPTNPDLNS